MNYIVLADLWFVSHSCCSVSNPAVALLKGNKQEMTSRHLQLQETYIVSFRIAWWNRCWLFLLLIFSCGLSHIRYFVYCYYINLKSNFIMLGVCATLWNTVSLCEWYRLVHYRRVYVLIGHICIYYIIIQKIMHQYYMSCHTSTQK